MTKSTKTHTVALIFMALLIVSLCYADVSLATIGILASAIGLTRCIDQLDATERKGKT